MIVPLLGKGLAKYNSPGNRKVAMRLARQAAGLGVRAVQARRRRKGRKVRFPNAARMITGTSVTQRSAANMTVQTIVPKPLVVADTEQCTFAVPKADGSSLGMPVSPYTPLLWPKLSTKVSTYSHYRQTGVITIYYNPQVGTDYQGSIVMGFSKDVTQENLSYQEISALPLSVSCPLAQNCTLSIPVSLTNQAVYKQMTITPGNQVLDLSDASSYLGLFHYAVDGSTGASTPGYFRVSYSFIFETPKMDVSPSGASIEFEGSTVTITKCPQIYLKLDSNLTGTYWSPTNVNVFCVIPAAIADNILIRVDEFTFNMANLAVSGGKAVYRVVLPKGYHTVMWPSPTAAADARFWLHRTNEPMLN